MLEPAQQPTTSDSIDIVYDELKKRITVQDAQIGALDGKANFGLASASLLTAGIAGLQNTFLTAQKAGPVSNISIFGFMVSPTTLINVLTVASFVAYVVVVLTAYMAYRILDFRVVPIPDKFVEKYLDKPPLYTKKRLIRTLVVAFHENERLVNQKVRWTVMVQFQLTQRVGEYR